MNFPKLLKQLPSSSWSTLITIESLNSDNQRLSFFCYSEAWSSVWPISAAEALLTFNNGLFEFFSIRFIWYSVDHENHCVYAAEG